MRASMRRWASTQELRGRTSWIEIGAKAARCHAASDRDAGPETTGGGKGEMAPIHGLVATPETRAR